MKSLEELLKIAPENVNDPKFRLDLLQALKRSGCEIQPKYVFDPELFYSVLLQAVVINHEESFNVEVDPVKEHYSWSLSREVSWFKKDSENEIYFENQFSFEDNRIFSELETERDAQILHDLLDNNEYDEATYDDLYSCCYAYAKDRPRIKIIESYESEELKICIRRLMFHPDHYDNDFSVTENQLNVVDMIDSIHRMDKKIFMNNLELVCKAIHKYMNRENSSLDLRALEMEIKEFKVLSAEIFHKG